MFFLCVSWTSWLGLFQWIGCGYLSGLGGVRVVQWTVC